jgi:phosphate transport system substrate-binding protein
MKRALSLGAAIGAAAMLAACGGRSSAPPPGFASPPSGSIVIHAAGNDYAAPIYEELGNVFQRSGITLNYQLVGSPGLVSARRPGAVPLVASDSWRSVGSMAVVDGASYVPVGFGAVSLVYNLPAVHRLRLSAAALAAIFSGAVTRWNARVIAKSNPGIALPPMGITVLHRSDPSVDTALLTQYLSDTSRRWRRTLGSAPAVNWPAGTAVAGEAGMLELLPQTPGAIGYVSQAAAIQNKLRSALVQNKARAYVAPTIRATTAVGDQPGADKALSVSTIDSPSSGAYPIAAEAYAETFEDPCQAGFSLPETHGLARLLDYLVGGAGQGLVARFSLAPLPSGLRAGARAAVGRLRCDGQPL